MPAQAKPQPLKEWVDSQRERMLAKMATAKTESDKRNYEGQADAYMSVLIHMAVYGESD